MTPDSLILFGEIPIWVAPLWMVAAGLAVGAAILTLFSALMRVAAPKVAAISWTTSKEAMSQPLFYVLMAIGVFGLILFPFVPYNTLGEDIKMLKEDGLTLVMVLSVIMAFWTASVSIAETPGVNS